MAIGHPSSALLSSVEPSHAVPASVTIGHVQLRDVLICPRERGVVNYLQHQTIVEHDIVTPFSTPRRLAKLSFTPNSLTAMRIPGADTTLFAAGGQEAELHLSLHRPVPPSSPTASSSKRPKPVWQFEAILPGSINNAVLLTSANQSAAEPRVVVSNNDCSVKFFDVPIRTETTRPTIREAGVLRLRVPVNHSSISPDGRTLLSVGDDANIHLHALSGGARVSFSRITTLALPPSDATPVHSPSSSPSHLSSRPPSSVPRLGSTLTSPFSSSYSPYPSSYSPQYPTALTASFSSAFSSDGTKFAVASQEGSVAVWDVRSSVPLKVFHTARRPHSPQSTFSARESLGYSADPWEWTRGACAAPGWGVRSVKFANSGSGEVLLWTEHTARIHVVDARTFEGEEVIAMPAVPSSFYPGSLESDGSMKEREQVHRGTRARAPSPNIIIHQRRIIRQRQMVLGAPQSISVPLNTVVPEPPFTSPPTQRESPLLGSMREYASASASTGVFALDPEDAEAERDREREMDIDAAEAEAEAECTPAHTPPRSRSPIPIPFSNPNPGEEINFSANYMARSLYSPEANREQFGEEKVCREAEREADLAGLCVDPTGGFVYVASTAGIAEWEVRGREERWWRGGEWM
ncbi:hypothetical protein HWV62_5016 [Athelia sp. TMB]|nr:hypothetical protein HWV62_5016 [Athelia sp. TMB]